MVHVRDISQALARGFSSSDGVRIWWWSEKMIMERKDPNASRHDCWRDIVAQHTRGVCVKLS